MAGERAHSVFAAALGHLLWTPLKCQRPPTVTKACTSCVRAFVTRKAAPPPFVAVEPRPVEPGSISDRWSELSATSEQLVSC